MLHFEFGKSWSYHPFGVVILGIMLLFVVNLLIPARASRAIQKLIDRRYEMIEGYFIGLVVAFVSFGLFRIIVQVVERAYS